MSDPKDIDWNEVVEDAQRLDMLRLQREQTELLRGMSSGSKHSSVQDIWERRLGMTQAQDPWEYARRKKAWQKKEFNKGMKVLLISFGLMMMIPIVGAFFWNLSNR
jgi:hypothetical protein